MGLKNLTEPGEFSAGPGFGIIDCSYSMMGCTLGYKIIAVGEYQ